MFLNQFNLVYSPTIAAIHILDSFKHNHGNAPSPLALTGYFRSSLTSSTDIASYYYCMWGSKYVVICIMHLTIIIKYGTLLNKILFETSILRKYLPLENTIYTDEEPSLHKNALSLQRLHSFSPCSHNAIYI